MSVTLSDWLRPLLFTTTDDRETGEILAECCLPQLADAYAFLHRAWQKNSASDLVSSLQVLAAMRHLHWIDSTESQAWLELFAQRLQKDYPKSEQLIARLEEENYSTVKLERMTAANFSNWQAKFTVEHELKNLATHFPKALKARNTPIGYALAVRSSGFVVYQQALDNQESLREKFWPDVKATLNDYWQVYSGKDCRQLLYWMAGQGQRYAWQIDVAWLNQAEEADRDVWLSELPEDFSDYADLITNLEPASQLDVAAWDWVRMADLAFAGYLAGYLTQGEWRTFALVALWLLRSQYASWQALADSYLLGYKLWKTQTDFTLSPELENTWELLLASPFSPFQQLDWQALSLDHPDFRDAKANFSAALDDPFLLTTLIASLRDDACLLTGLAPSELPDECRDEAKDYLFVGLDIHPDEELTSTLARFWQPGRIHHYDQLALNCRINKVPRLAKNLAAIPEVWDIWQRQLPELAELVKHPAGIVMAEKYAFYLVKAEETQHYPAAERQQLTLALIDYLSWHYSSAQEMLLAWQGWDDVLSKVEDEKPLLTELAWHLKDPGSLFRFIPWQRPPASVTEPGKPVSEADLATLNLVGPLTGIHWSWPERLPEWPRNELKSLLQDTHLFQTADDLIDYLNHLFHAGDRQEYMIAFSPFTLNEARLDSEIETQAHEERDEEQDAYYQRLLRVKHNTLGINDVDLTAWDMVQLVDLAVAGYQLNWLNDDQLRDWLAKVRKLITEEYYGWDDFARALLAGYNFFMNESEQRDELLETFSQRLLSLLIAVPPQVGLWYTLAWPGEKARDWNQTSTALITAKQRLH